MKRPSKTGLLVLLAFSVPVVIEFRTLLSMVGIQVDTRLYLTVSGVLLILALAAIWLLPEKPGSGNGGDSTGNGKVRPGD